MAFQPVPDAIEVRARYTLAGAEEALNVFHFELDTELQTDAIYEDLADAVKDAWVTHLKPVVSDEITLRDITVTDLSDEDGRSLVFFYNEAGENEIEQLPQQCAGLVKWVTAKRGRSWHGRTYLAGFCEDQSNGVNFTTAAQDAMNAWADAMRDVMSGDPVTPTFVVVSRVSNGAPRVGDMTEPITDGRASSVIRTMRTRAKYRTG